MPEHDNTLSAVGRALGRGPNDPVPDPPPVTLHYSGPRIDQKVAKFVQALTALAGKVSLVSRLDEARARVESILAGRRALASCAPILAASGIANLPGVSTEFSRETCAAVEVGITSADFALADTGTLVLMTESGESRMISLLPPGHIAVIAQSKILENLDEFFAVVPQPAAHSSAMVLITGPSRTADIEMRLVRGVHGPGEIHVVIVDDVTPCIPNASEET